MKYNYDSETGQTEIVVDGEVHGQLSGWPTTWANGVVPHPNSDLSEEFESILSQMPTADGRVMILHIIANNVEMNPPEDVDS